MGRGRVFAAAALLAVMAVGIPELSAADNTVTMRSISVTGQGEAAGEPDRAELSVGVQTKAATVVEASRQNQEVVDRMMKALDELGIDRKNIQTANYSIWPEQRQDPRGNGEVAITGYDVNNMVNVTVDDIGKVGTILGALTGAGANSVQGIMFGVKDTAALEQRARAAAMADARLRAESLAKLAGVDLGDVQSISTVSGGGYPMPLMGGARFAVAEAVSVAGISPGQSSVSVQVQVTFAIR